MISWKRLAWAMGIPIFVACAMAMLWVLLLASFLSESITGWVILAVFVVVIGAALYLDKDFNP